MPHVGFGADAGASNNIDVTTGEVGTLLNWKSNVNSQQWDQLARVVLTQTAAGAVSLGTRFNVYRVLSNYQTLVSSFVLLENAAEVIVNGPYDRIMIGYEQLTTTQRNHISASVFARTEFEKPQLCQSSGS